MWNEFSLNQAVLLGLVTVLAAPELSSGGPAFANAVTNGTLSIAGLTEASGVVASRNNQDVLWTHNDAGHPAQVFALDTQGRLLGTYTLPGNTDNEDIAIGPGPVTNVLYLYVADIGDNKSSRASIQIYQIPEPAVYARQYTHPVTASLKGARTIVLTYPDGARDAEAMFVDPLTGDLFIASKEFPSRIYSARKAQLDTSDSCTLRFVRTLRFKSPSAADISPAGNEIIMRRESRAALWTRAGGQSVSQALGGRAISIPVAGRAHGEPNGEAIGFDSIGSGYFTLSDSATTQPLRYFARTSSDGPRAPRLLVPAGAAWKYLDDGSNQGTAWRQPDFNDSSWRHGVARFGYGDGDEQTVVNFGGAAANKPVTVYFRKSFIAERMSGIARLTLKLVVDDGAIVYLNGTPVVYENLSGDTAYDTLATAMPVAFQSTWHTYRIEPSLLVEGANALAVEIHQSSVTGSNISFDLQLLGE